MLWAFDVAEPTDPTTGKIIPLDVDAYNPGILQAPLPFKAKITPRSPEHVASIRREIESALDFLSPWE
jgi:hypothetical protein